MPVKPVKSLALSSIALLEAVHKLEGVALPGRTLRDWVNRGVVTPSIRMGQRGGAGGGLWSLADLARVRLAARLRHGGLTGHQISAAFVYLEDDLRELLQPHSTASVIVDRRRVYVQRPGASPRDPETGQLLMDFKLATLFVGNEAAARNAQRAAAA